MITDWTFYAIAAPAVILVGLSKGGLSGLGMLTMPMLTLVIGPVQAAGIMLPILIVQDWASVWSYRKSWDWWNLSILVPSAAVGIVLGYLLAARLSEASVALALGVISVVFSIRQLWLRRRPPPEVIRKPSVLFGWICGIGVGFTSMVAQAGGPPYQIYVMPQRLPRDIFVGTSVVLFTLVNLIKIPPFLMLGQINQASLMTSAMLMPVAVASTRAGVYIVRRMRGDMIYTVASVLLLLVGLRLTWQGMVPYF